MFRLDNALSVTCGDSSPTGRACIACAILKLYAKPEFAGLWALFISQYSLFIPSLERPFAVPDKIFGLTLILDFIDRGTHCALAVSATGSARARDRGEIFSQKKEQREP